MPAALYIDSSAILRAALETGTTPDVEARIAASPILVTSRLSQVEVARALIRALKLHRISQKALSDCQRQLDSLWARCNLWELTPGICELACRVAPEQSLRTLDALHLATFLSARRRIEYLEMLTADDRLEEAARTV